MDSYIKLQTEQGEVYLYDPEIIFNSDGVSLKGVSSDLVSGNTCTAQAVPLKVWSQKFADNDPDGIFRDVVLKTGNKDSINKLISGLVELKSDRKLVTAKTFKKGKQTPSWNLAELLVTMSQCGKWSFKEKDSSNNFENDMFSVTIYPDNGIFSCPSYNYNVTWNRNIERSNHPNRNIRDEEMKSMIQECLESIGVDQLNPSVKVPIPVM